MNVSTTTSAVQATTAAATAGATKTLGENDFLKLLTAQLQAQNPLNPMDSTNFTAQLAQFSSLEQLTNVNTNLKNMLTSQQSLQNTMASDLIGKKVMVSGNTVTLNGQANMNFSLSADASKAIVSIYDANGALVRTQSLTKVAAGDNTYQWDGKDKNGNDLPAGPYSFDITAIDSSGNVVTATPVTAGTVTGVTFDNNVTYLTIDNGTKVQLGDIHEILGGA
jgi:flagellar basal-body rod modification protein FlgD